MFSVNFHGSNWEKNIFFSDIVGALHARRKLSGLLRDVCSRPASS